MINNKNDFFSIIVLLIFTNDTSYGSYSIIIPIKDNPIVFKDTNWITTSPTYGEWINISGKVKYNCKKWEPNPRTLETTSIFTQSSECLTDQIRTYQNNEISKKTGEIKPSGSILYENRTIKEKENRLYSVEFSKWLDSKNPSCEYWTPKTSVYYAGQTFTQTGENCTVYQTRTRSENYIDPLTGENIVVSTVEQSQKLTEQQRTRSEKGITSYCTYHEGDYQSRIIDFTDGDIYVYYDGKLIGLLPNGIQSSIENNGISYKIGKIRSYNYFEHNYEVCLSLI